MNYETPEITAMAPAAEAVQGSPKLHQSVIDSPAFKEPSAAYQDWEE
jgi:hypothetical protein